MVPSSGGESVGGSIARKGHSASPYYLAWKSRPARVKSCVRLSLSGSDMTISADSVVVATKHQVSCELDAETVILHFDKGLYFGLNDVGTIVWNQLQSPRTVRELRDAIMREYEVSTDQCEHDLVQLIQELGKQGLVEVRDVASQ